MERTGVSWGMNGMGTPLLWDRNEKYPACAGLGKGMECKFWNNCLAAGIIEARGWAVKPRWRQDGYGKHSRNIPPIFHCVKWI